MLQFGLRLGAHPRQMVTTTPRPIPLLKRFLADPTVAVSRAAHLRQRRQSGAGLSRHGGGPLCRLAPRPSGTRRRDDRGSSRCAVDARSHRELPRRCGAAAGAHRRRGRSAGLARQSAPMPAASSPPASTMAASRYVLADETAAALEAARMGGRRRSRCIAALAGRRAGGGDQPGRRNGDERHPRSRSRRCRSRACVRRAANICAPSRSRCSTRKAACAMWARCPNSKTNCAISARAVSPPAARRTGSMRWSGRSPN